MAYAPVIINGVECYGTLNEYSNVNVLCEDEMDDFIWLTREPKEHPTWKEVVSFLQERFEVVELQAI